MLQFIVNPGSRSGTGIKIWEEVEDMLQDRNIPYECHMSRGPGDTARLALDIYQTRRPCTLVAVGGDGSINEILSALPSFEDILFAYIPTGSGNDFARGLGLPKKPADCIRMILESTGRKTIRIGQAVSADSGASRSFAVSSGMGFDAAICNISVSSRAKRILNAVHLGRLVYPLGFLRLLRSLRSMTLELTPDGAPAPSVYPHTWFAVTMNLPYEGGGFKFCPNASAEDDLLDVLVVNPASKLAMIRLLIPALTGRHIGTEGIHILRCRKVSFHSSAPQTVHTDGEHLGECSSVTFSLRSERLEIITP